VERKRYHWYLRPSLYLHYGCVHPAGLAEAHESEGERGKVRLATQGVRSVAGSNGQSGLKSVVWNVCGLRAIGGVILLLHLGFDSGQI